MTSIFRFSAPTALRQYYRLAIARRARQSRAVFVFGPHFVRAGLRLRFLFRYATTGAEADVRERVRGRDVSVQRQVRQVRAVSVEAAPEATDRLLA